MLKEIYLNSVYQSTRSIEKTFPGEPAYATNSFTPRATKKLRALRAVTLFLEKTIHTSLKTEGIERRAAIDVGSGSTKVAIADVDPRTGQIVQMIYEASFPVPYQAYLENSPDHTFNAQIQEMGLTTFAKIQQILGEHQVSQTVAVATEAYRKAANGNEFAQAVAEKTGILLRVISQQTEGEIAFYSALATSKERPEEMIIWDIGTGSFQMIADQEWGDDLAIYMQSIGSVPFKNYIIHEIQGKDPSVEKSPNPMSEEEWLQADSLARWMGRHALERIKDKIKTVNGRVIGIGRLFSNSVRPMGHDGKITRSDLRAFIRSCLGHTDEELGDPFANVNVSNAILVLGVMKALHIHEIEIIETTSTKGILCYEPYWNL